MRGRVCVCVCVCVRAQSVDWLRFVRSVFSEVDIDISDSEELIVRCPDYVLELGRLLQRTPPRSVHYYATAGVAEYCDERVCLSVCVSASISPELHVRSSVHVTYGCGSDPLWRRYLLLAYG